MLLQEGNDRQQLVDRSVLSSDRCLERFEGESATREQERTQKSAQDSSRANVESIPVEGKFR